VTDDLRQRYADALLNASLDGLKEFQTFATLRDAALFAADVVLAVRDKEMAALREERDQVIAHDRQPYPTQWAYDQACAALETQRQRAEQAEAILRELIDPSPCDHFDHHGQCQTHGAWDDQGRCLHARGRELLVALDEPEAAHD
jgi:hypothetical protein